MAHPAHLLQSTATATATTTATAATSNALSPWGLRASLGGGRSAGAASELSSSHAGTSRQPTSNYENRIQENFGSSSGFGPEGLGRWIAYPCSQGPT